MPLCAPNLPAIHTNLGVCLTRSGDVGAALAAYEAALAASPDHVPALHNKAAALRNLGKPDEAVDTLKLLAALPGLDSPTRRRATADLVNALLVAGRWGEVVNTATPALTPPPSAPAAHASLLTARGVAHRELGALDAGVADLTAALDTGAAPSHARAQLSDALQRTALSLHADAKALPAGGEGVALRLRAVDLLDRAIALQPLEGLSYNRAVLLMEAGESERAVVALRSLLKSAAAATPKPGGGASVSTLAHGLLGGLLLRREAWADAEAHLAVVRDDPNTPAEGKLDAAYVRAGNRGRGGGLRPIAPPPSPRTVTPTHPRRAPRFAPTNCTRWSPPRPSSRRSWRRTRATPPPSPRCSRWRRSSRWRRRRPPRLPPPRRPHAPCKRR